LSKTDVETLRAWGHLAPVFRTRHKTYRRRRASFKDNAFREVYGELIAQTIQGIPVRAPYVLKADLWNEGVENGRDLASTVHKACSTSVLIGMDVSLRVCEFAKKNRNFDLQIVNGSILTPPFRPEFDLLIDASTIDHVPASLREDWLSSEAYLLREGGELLISFDCGLNLINELFHKLVIRKMYPEWTIMPITIRSELLKRRFRILSEHAIFIAGLIGGTHCPSLPGADMLKRIRVVELLKRIELSKWSRFLSFLSPQYVIVAEKLPANRKD
jgi:hypothetical protein